MVRIAIAIVFFATVVGALMPSRPSSPDDAKPRVVRVETLSAGTQSDDPSDSDWNSVSLERSLDGHFYADAEVNGATIHFLVDTGATGIALSAADARRAGLVFSSNQAEVIGMGASGQVLGHFVRLRRVQLGLKSVNDTPAVVLEGGDRSLLGQTFLAQFGSVEIHGNTMVLR